MDYILLPSPYDIKSPRTWPLHRSLSWTRIKNDSTQKDYSGANYGLYSFEFCNLTVLEMWPWLIYVYLCIWSCRTSLLEIFRIKLIWNHNDIDHWRLKRDQFMLKCQLLFIPYLKKFTATSMQRNKMYQWWYFLSCVKFVHIYPVLI